MDEAQLARILDHIDEKSADKDSAVLFAISEVKSDTKLLTQSMEQIKKDVQEHEEFIKGPPYPGAAKILDRLSQSSKFQKRGLWVVAIAAIGSLARVIAGLFTTTSSAP